jgi:hypothetical protein
MAFTTTSTVGTGEPRSYSSLADAQYDSKLSRIYVG